MGIRTKIMLGFIILASMLFISGAISIFELTKLGKSVKGLIYDNYRSIDYSRDMLDALEQQEYAILLYMVNKNEDALRTFRIANDLFEQNIELAKTNLTQEGELTFVDSVRIHYYSFYRNANDFINGGDFRIDYYVSEIQPKLHSTSEQVKNLITVNQEALYKSAIQLESSAQRAIMPGLIVILTSLIFTFVFTYLVHHYFVSPIIRLTKGINDYVKYRKPLDVPLETRDEIWKLKESIVKLITICKTPLKKSE